MNEISDRRFGGFTLVALAAVVGTLTIGCLMSPSRSPVAPTLVAATTPPPTEPGRSIQIPPPIR